jgi:DNA-binding CsgD family transcriptional regulator
MKIAKAAQALIEIGKTLAESVQTGAPNPAHANRYLETYLIVTSGRDRRVPLPEASLPAAAESPITSRQAEVLRLATVGHNNKEIAQILGIASGTVKAHLRNVRKRMR